MAERPRLLPRAQACGKVILLGEHAVVYGHPALAVGIPSGITLDAREIDPAAPLELSIPAWDLDLRITPGTDHPVARAVLEVLSMCDGPLRGWAIAGRTDLPSGAGLGSSAALTVALARLCLGERAPIDEVVEASLAGERVFHGQPSGLDSQIAARGGILRFAKASAPSPVTAPPGLRLVVIPSGQPRRTAEQIAKVRDRYDRLPEVVRPVLDALAATVVRGLDALRASDLALLGELMNVAHELLGALGVSTPRLDELCDAALQCGALGAKLTGAGGGGAVIALCPPDPEPLRSALAGRGLAPLLVELS
jgi:mevalonate kinase